MLCLDNLMSGNLMDITHLLDCWNLKLVSADARSFDLAREGYVSRIGGRAFVRKDFQLGGHNDKK